MVWPMVAAGPRNDEIMFPAVSASILERMTY